MHRSIVPVAVALCLVLASGSAMAAPPLKGKAGAAGIGDPYYPTDGNGGYDVVHYDLDLAYEPDTGVLTGLATIDAVATQNLSRLQLDYDGPTISSVVVAGSAAKWRTSKGELIIDPRAVIPTGDAFRIAVAYGGVPELLIEETLGFGGWIATDDGGIAVGQPHGATTWFPANDHPLDTATYSIALDVPDGTEAISNGRLASNPSVGGRTIWTWEVEDRMASYLATVAVGQFDVTSATETGIDYWDAIDPDLLTPIAVPSDGTQLAISGVADLSYQRLARVISVPAGGATVAFDITRDTEEMWDFVFVEAHTVGQDDWTTLADANGHTSPETGFVCPFSHTLHPFLGHYQTADGPEGCLPTGSTGTWSAATGRSEGAERWSVDLGAFAGSVAELAIAYVSDDIIQGRGVFVDDIVVSTGDGTTSFEDDGDTLDDWTVPGPPAGSPGNDADWTVGGVADLPPAQGAVAADSFARQPEILAFLSDRFGPYPFGQAGGIVDDVEGLGFALETQTRPVYSRDFFEDPIGADSVVVHELAHQWYGDSLALARWQDIWLNEGFATYAEWLWSEDQGLDTTQEIFDFWATVFPPEEGFWQVTIGDPGPDALFDFAVYIRGAMTLHTLRGTVGDAVFFEILESWATSRRDSNVTTSEFIELAEDASGQELDELFERWLSTPGYPLDAVPSAAARRAPTAVDRPVVLVAERLERLGGAHRAP
jgi:hypothetical protein